MQSFRQSGPQSFGQSGPHALSTGGGVRPLVYPVVTGDAIEGETLSVSTGTWPGTPDSYSYQWYRADILVGGDVAILFDGEVVFVDEAEVITGETTNEYVVRNEDAGYDGKDYVIWCDVTAVYGGKSYTVSAEATGPVQIATYAETTSLLARMDVQPDSTRAALINLTIGRLKYEEIWDLAGFIHFHAAHDAQAARLDWKAANDLTISGTPTFTVDLGHKGNGTDSFLSTGVAPNALTNYAQNAATVATWETENISSAAVALGLQSAATVQTLGRNTSDNVIARVNAGSGIDEINPNLDSRGLTSSTRTGASAQILYFAGVQIDTGTAASSTLSSSPFVYLRSATVYSTRRVGFGFAGGILTADQHLALYEIVRDYMIAVGAA